MIWELVSLLGNLLAMGAWLPQAVRVIRHPKRRLPRWLAPWCLGWYSVALAAEITGGPDRWTLFFALITVAGWTGVAAMGTVLTDLDRRRDSRQ